MTQMIDWMQQRGVPRCDWWPGYDSTRILRADDDGIADLVEYRWDVIAEFGFPIVTDALVDSLAIIGREMPILDAGCGTGYLAWELQQRGVTVLPVDPEPFTFINATPKRQWLEPVRLPAQQVAAQHPDHALLLSWPSLGRTWPHLAAGDAAGVHAGWRSVPDPHRGGCRGLLCHRCLLRLAALPCQPLAGCGRGADGELGGHA